MKKIYLIIGLVCSSLLSSAQLILTKAANEAVVGDINLTKSFDTVGVFPKNAGTGQSWNFSTMVSNSFTEATTYTTVAASPSPALFSNANIASNRGGNQWDFKKSNATTLEFAGMIFGTTNYVNFINTAVEFSWPISFGSAMTDTFTATETNGTNTVNWTGSTTYTAAGSGTVTLPGGGVYTNCLMIKSITNVTMAGSTSTTQMVMINYDWFASGFKFPLVHSEYQSTTTGTFVTKQIYFSINSLALPVGLNENKIERTDLTIFPNPANTEINISLANAIENYKVTLTDLSGKSIVERNNVKSINVSNIEKGIYILTVNGKNINARKTIVITH